MTGLAETEQTDQLDGGVVGEGFDLAVELGAAQAHFGGEGIDVDVGVADALAEDGEEGGKDGEEELLYVRSGSGNLQNWLDVPLLMAKKITLDYGGTLEMKRQEDGRQVRMVTLPCIVS